MISCLHTVFSPKETFHLGKVAPPYNLGSLLVLTGFQKHWWPLVLGALAWLWQIEALAEQIQGTSTTFSISLPSWVTACWQIWLWHAREFSSLGREMAQSLETGKKLNNKRHPRLFTLRFFFPLSESVILAGAFMCFYLPLFASTRQKVFHT